MENITEAQKLKMEKIKRVLKDFSGIKKLSTGIDQISKVLYNGKSVFKGDDEIITSTIAEHFQNPRIRRICGIRTSLIDEIKENEKEDEIQAIEFRCSDVEKLLDAVKSLRKGDKSNTKEHIRKKMEEMIENPNLLFKRVWASTIVYSKLRVRLEYKQRLAHNAENAIKKIGMGKGKELTQEELDSLQMIAYSSEYMPDTENESILQGNLSEAEIISRMKSSNNPLILPEDKKRTNNIGLPCPNKILFEDWKSRYSDRYDTLIETEGITEEDIALFDSIDMMRGTRNSIAHGTFIYNPEIRTLQIESQVGIKGEDGNRKPGYLECELNVDCVLDLCRNVFSRTGNSTVLQNIDNGFDGTIPINKAELFKYYINSVFAYNGWILTGYAAEVKKQEPLAESLDKFVSLFKDENNQSLLPEKTDNMTKEEINARFTKVSSILTHLRNATVHGRITSDNNGNILIRDKEKNAEAGLFEETFSAKISESDFEYILSNFDMTKDIQKTTNDQYLTEVSEIGETNNLTDATNLIEYFNSIKSTLSPEYRRIVEAFESRIKDIQEGTNEGKNKKLDDKEHEL